MSASAFDAIAREGSPVDLLRNAQSKPTIFPVTPEFSNWRSEQRSWRESVALLDQSHHMTDLFISGPDALRLLSDTGVNSFARFPVDAAKQFIAVNHEGYLIGDAILFHLDEQLFDLVGWYMVLDWVQFIGETGDYDVTFERDANTLMREPGVDRHPVCTSRPTPPPTACSSTSSSRGRGSAPTVRSRVGRACASGEPGTSTAPPTGRSHRYRSWWVRRACDRARGA